MAIVTVPLKVVLPFHMDSPSEALPNGWAVCEGQTLTNPNDSDPATWVQHINPGANATYTLPDLRNYSLLGADQTKSAGQAGVAVGHADINVAAGAPGPKGTGGGNQHQLTTAQLAAHGHGTGSHTHTMNDAGHSHGVTDPGHSHGTTDPGHNHVLNDFEHAHQISANHLTTGQVTGGSGNVLTGLAHYGQGTQDRVSQIEGTGITMNNANTSIAVNSASTGATVNNATTGVTANNATGFISNAGSDSPHENRPRYYGIVFIMKVKN